MALKRLTNALQRLLLRNSSAQSKQEAVDSTQSAKSKEQRDAEVARFIRAWIHDVANITIGVSEQFDLLLLDGKTGLLGSEKIVAALQSGDIDLCDILEPLRKSIDANNITLPPDASIAIRHCVIKTWSQEGQPAQTLPLLFVGCRFNSVFLDKAVFSARVTFRKCTFSSLARFCQSTFNNGLRMSSCRFPDLTSFFAATIRNVLSITRTKFGDECSFQFMFVERDLSQTGMENDSVDLPAGRLDREQIERITGYRLISNANYADIHRCKFGKSANFRCATFNVMTQFTRTTFDDNVDFFSARFAEITKFDEVQFYGFGRFDDVGVGKKLTFDFARLGLVDFGKLEGQRIDIANASFAGRDFGNALFLFFRARSLAYSRSSRRGTRATLYRFFRARSPANSISSRRGTRATWLLPPPLNWAIEVTRAYGVNGFGWKAVRGLAELKIFTRVSFAALLIVPVIATMWMAGNRVVMKTVRIGSNAVVSSEKNIESLRQKLASVDSVEHANAKIKEDLAYINMILTRCRESIGEHQWTSALGYWLVGHEVGKTVAGVDESIDHLQHQLDDLSATPADPNDIASMKTRADAFLKHVFDDLKTVEEQLKAIENRPTHLPQTFAESFAAALALLVGQLIYQLRAPKLVKDRGSDQFVRERKKEFSERAADAKAQLANAADEIHRLSERTYLIRHPNLLLRLGKTYWLPSIPDCLFSACGLKSHTTTPTNPTESPDNGIAEAVTNHGMTSDSVEHGDDSARCENGRQMTNARGVAAVPAARDALEPIYPDRERMIVMIEEGAKAEYEYANRSNPISAIVATALYIFAMSLIAIALLRQTLVVTLATGYEPWPWLKSVAQFLGAYPHE